MHSKKSTTFAPAIRKLHPQFGVWCNGNTADSGPAFPGSSPGTPTRRKASNIWKLFFLLNTSILVGCIKAGTGLHGVQVVMTYDEGTGIALFQFQEQLPQSLSLCLGASVGRLSVVVESALVAHTYRVFVVSLAVCPHHIFRSSHFARSE